MRKLVWLAMFASAAACRASFDLMYIPDANETLVHRYDPVNRVYLGSFNAPARYVSGSNSTPIVAVTPYGGLPAFYHGGTGEFQTSTSDTGMASILMRSFGTEILGSTGSSIRRYDTATGTLLQSVVYGGTMTFGATMAEIATGRTAVLGLSSAGIVVQTYSSTLGFLNQTTLVATSGVASDAALSSMAFVSLGGVSHLVFTYRNSSNAVTLARVAMNGGLTATTVSTTTITGFSTTSTGTTTSVMAGHGGTFFVTGLSTTGSSTRIRQMYTAGGVLTTSQDYTTSAFVAPASAYWQGSNIVAPEPCSMLALAGGLAAMLRKRRRRQ